MRALQNFQVPATMSNVNVVKGTRWVLAALCITTVILLLRINPSGLAGSYGGDAPRDEPELPIKDKSPTTKAGLQTDREILAEVTPSSTISLGTPVVGGVVVGADTKKTIINVTFTPPKDVVVTSDAVTPTEAPKTAAPTVVVKPTDAPKTEAPTATPVVLSTAAPQSETKPPTTPTTDSDKPPAEQKKRLNILVMYPDDWRHDSLGCAGAPVLTPFLDSLAQEGIRFTHNCVTTSICWVSRATHFTGQYLSRHKSPDLMNPTFYRHWNDSYPYLLQKAGYYSGHVGKWQYSNYTWVEEQFNWTRLHEGYHWFDEWSPNGTIQVHAADKATDEAIQFLKERPKDRPFSLSVAYYPPKAIGSSNMQWSPRPSTLKLYENITIPEPRSWNNSWHLLPKFLQNNEARVRWKQRFGNYTLYQNGMKAYFAMMTEVDAACKKLVGELKKQGILDDTLVIFTVDNGFFHGEHGLSGKWFPYQESIRVPLIIRDPRMPKSKIGTLDDSFTLNIDLATTILGAANVEPSPVMQGRDMSDLYLDPKAKDSWRKEFFYEHMSMGRDYIPASSALVRKDFKYFLYEEWKTEQLFDLKNDPYENHDLSNQSEYAELLKEMRKRHDELKALAA